MVPERRRGKICWNVSTGENMINSIMIIREVGAERERTNIKRVEVTLGQLPERSLVGKGLFWNACQGSTLRDQFNEVCIIYLPIQYTWNL